MYKEKGKVNQLKNMFYVIKEYTFMYEENGEKVFLHKMQFQLSPN